MNALEGECSCFREISINVNKLLAVLLLYIFSVFFILHFAVGYLLLDLSFFILMLLLYFRLFINPVNKAIIFVFRAFLNHFKHTISIFVIIIIEENVIYALLSFAYSFTILHYNFCSFRFY